jgi:hypothetical protein
MHHASGLNRCLITAVHTKYKCRRYPCTGQAVVGIISKLAWIFTVGN